MKDFDHWVCDMENSISDASTIAPEKPKITIDLIDPDPWDTERANPALYSEETGWKFPENCTHIDLSDGYAKANEALQRASEAYRLMKARQDDNDGFGFLD